MQARFKSFDFVVLAGGIFLIVLDVLLGHNNPNGLLSTALFIC